MTVTSLEKDLETGTLTIVSEYPGTVALVWQLWADALLVEQPT